MLESKMLGAWRANEMSVNHKASLEESHLSAKQWITVKKIRSRPVNYE
jgi:hypothetical protein